MLAYLVLEHRRFVTRDELANALWPQLLPDSWAAALRSVVTEVRRFLDDGGLDGGKLIASSRGGYRFQLPAGVTVDVEEAREAVRGARTRLERDDPRGATAAASRAAALSSLPFLPRHDGHWVQGIRDELEAIHTSALELQARGHLDSGDTRAARAAAERLVRHEPYSEASYQLLIEVLGRAADRTGAQSVYEQCRSMLRAELGLEPSAETQAALRRALAAPPGASAPSSAIDRALPGSAPGTYAVLVVEDHDFQRRAALALLGRLGVGVLLEAPNGQAALDLLDKVAPPDVIVCDIDMPVMDGVEFIRHVARRGLASAVAIVSDLDGGMLKAARAVAEGYGLQVLGAVEKPLTGRVLSELLSAYQPPSTGLGGAPLRVSARELLTGLADGQLAAEVQPIADLSSGRIAAGELIPHWHHGGDARLRHVGLRAVSSSSETAAAVGDRLLALGSRVARDVAVSGVSLDIVVPLATLTLADADLPDRFANRVRTSDADPHRITFAIEAAALPGGTTLALDVLTRLRLKGFGLWLDTAGSTSRLEQLPLTGVRLARWLSSDGHDALRDVVDRARGIRVKVIGTGCDSAALFETLLAAGATHAQGRFVADPMPADALAGFAHGWSPPASAVTPGRDDAGRPPG